MNKKSSLNQLALFELSPVGEEVMRNVRGTRWYYVVDAKLEQMLVMRPCGKFGTKPHELRYETPYLTNRRKEAERLCKHVKNGTVRIYPHDPALFNSSKAGRGGWHGRNITKK